MNKRDVWDILKKEHEMYPEDFGEHIREDLAIQKAQLELNLEFSLPYIKFLKGYGSAVAPGHIIYGLSPLEEMGDVIKTVIEKTVFYKEHQNWPGIEDWYIVSDDGSGNPIGIDPEGKVWLSDHDAGFEKIKLADDFEEFLYKVYSETLYL